MSHQTRIVNSISKEFQEIIKDMEQVEKAIQIVLKKIGKFNILDETLVPYGLKPIARSISWLVEQIVVQNLRKNSEVCGLSDVIDPPHSLTQYDCILKLKCNSKEVFVNLKTSLTTTDKTGNFDISKAPKLVQFYEKDPEAILLVAVIRVSIDGVCVDFDKPVIFNVAWVPKIYYNRANHNLQSSADGTQIMRSNSDFVKILKNEMKNAGHIKHY